MVRAIDVDEVALRARVASTLFGDEAVVVVGRYRLLEELGRGGLGVVWVAHDPELDRRVALKLIRRDAALQLGSEEMQRRLHREAQAMARLRHPNVVSVYDVGRDRGSLFIAMELVDGVTLRRFVAQRSRTWREIRDVLVHAGRGLAAAHREGLVHRDFKPGNVLVDTDGVARVLDFGLATAVVDNPDARGTTPSESLLDEPLTQAGALMGTPAYMAPEQFEAREVDARADQWAFCVTLFEALYGQRPFGGRTLEELAHAVRHDEPREPAGRQVPGWLFRVIRRGLSRDPADRYPSMTELLHATQRDKRSRRKLWLAAVGALVLCATTALATAAALAPRPTSQDIAAIEAIAAEARDAATQGRFLYPPADDPNAATAYVQVITLEAIDGAAEAMARSTAKALRVELAQRLLAIGDEHWDDPQTRGAAADFYAAARIFDAELERARERSMMTPGEIADLRMRAEARQFSAAELETTEILAALASGDAQAHDELVARSHRAPERPREAAVIVEPSPPETAPPIRDAPPPRAADRSGASEEVRAGKIALADTRLDEAERHFHRALAKDPRHAAALAGLSEVSFERGDHSAAVKHARHATELAPRSATYRMLLGDALVKVLHYAEARSEYETAKSLGHPRADRALERLARLTDG